MSDVSFYRRRRAWSRDVRSRDVCFPRDGANNELDQIFAAASSIYTKEATPASSCGYLCELNEIYEHVLLLNPSLKSSVVFRQLIRCMSTKRNTMPEFQANLIPVSILITNRLAKNVVLVRCTIVNPLMGTGNHSAASNNMKLVHWPLMGGLSHTQLHSPKHGRYKI